MTFYISMQRLTKKACENSKNMLTRQDYYTYVWFTQDSTEKSVSLILIVCRRIIY